MSNKKPADAASNAAPAVWVLTGGKIGDNDQCLTLARALGWPFEEKRLAYNSFYAVSNLLLGATLASLDRDRSAPLAPPWPDLVIGIGRRSVPVARWIRRRSGGRTRLVWLGRPRAPYSWFDVIATTPQYRLPARRNVVRLSLPLSKVLVRAAPADAAALRAFAHLPRPWIAVLVGGSTTTLRMDGETGRQLGAAASALARRAGGSLLVTTSRRTPEPARTALTGAIEVDAFAHGWSRGGEVNPYGTFLAEADAFVVTSDSASMLADACATGRPVYLFELPRLLRGTKSLTNRLERWLVARPDAVRARVFDWIAEQGLVSPARDLRLLHRRLVETGAVRLLQAETVLHEPCSGSNAGRSELGEVVGAIRGLFGAHVRSEA